MKKNLLIILATAIVIIVVAVVLIFVLSASPKMLNSCSIGPKTCMDGSKSFPVVPDCKHTCAEDLDNSGLLISIEDACIASGGTVATAPCCSSAREFPNTCAVGACGCSPDNSQETKTCTCPEGTCFDGSACTGVQAEESPVTPVE